MPPAVIDKAVEYIKRSQDSNTGGFCYQPHSRVTVACTGTGILALELCGKNLHRGPEVLKAAAYLSKHPPIWNNEYFFYMIYYCTQAMFQLGDNYWDFYGPKVKDVLLSHQQSNGSWSGGGSDGGHGPAYCTSMAVLALTVEYRFLPIYQREEPRKRSDGRGLTDPAYRTAVYPRRDTCPCPRRSHSRWRTAERTRPGQASIVFASDASARTALRFDASSLQQ